MEILVFILFWVALFAILMYLVIRSIRIKEGENFEERDN